MLLLSRRTALALFVAGVSIGAACSFGNTPAPNVSASRTGDPSPEEALIEQQLVCVGSAVHSAGDLGPALFYRSERLPTGEIAVGYYAFFSEERPWGNNWQTWLVFPALVTDLVYTRALLVAPGMQRLAYGKGDVEGFRVVYADGGGALAPKYAIADDATHTERRLSVADLFAVDPLRLTLYSTTLSHQLAGVGVRSAEDLAYERCYGPSEIRPLTAEIEREFRLDRRARPAHVGGASLATARVSTAR
jgi:hypothetical protein